MKRKWKVLIAIACVLLLALVALWQMLAKDFTYVPSAPFAPQGEVNRDVAVVYYSRSGHSEAVAREVARTLNAPIARIEADYPRDWAGNMKAFNDARAHALPPIRVEPLDLRPARRVFLVSPNWESRPAPPVWAFLEQADLMGKEVVLVMTGNNPLNEDSLDAFAQRVRAKGGRFARTVYLQRGRFYWQKSREALLEETREAIGSVR